MPEPTTPSRDDTGTTHRAEDTPAVRHRHRRVIWLVRAVHARAVRAVRHVAARRHHSSAGLVRPLPAADLPASLPPAGTPRRRPAEPAGTHTRHRTCARARAPPDAGTPDQR